MKMLGLMWNSYVFNWGWDIHVEVWLMWVGLVLQRSHCQGVASNMKKSVLLTAGGVGGW
jgi:hypothetical protein